MDKIDWRDEVLPHSRIRAVRQIMNAVKLYRHFDDENELHELEKFSQSIERKTLAGATNLLDYLHQITTKMVSMERKMQDELYQKIQMLKEMYLPDLNEMHQRIANGLQQLDNRPQQTESNKREKLKIFKAKPWKLSLQPGQVPPHATESLSQPQPKPQLTQVRSHENQIKSQLQFQEEVYQRIQMLKEMYLPELNDIHQRMVNKVGQLDSDPQQAESVSCKMVKMFKAKMEGCIAFLQTSKSDISPALKEELPSHEKQIMNFIYMGRLIPYNCTTSVASSSNAAR